MSSEAVLEAAPMVGNAHLGQRGSGHSVVSLAQHVPRHRAGSTLILKQWNKATSKPGWSGVYVSQRLSFDRIGKARGGNPRSEPDSGNPTVRDRRGACGNVCYGIWVVTKRYSEARRTSIPTRVSRHVTVD